MPGRRSLAGARTINCVSLETCLFVLIHISDVTGSNAFFLDYFRIKVNTIRTPGKAIPLPGFGLSKKVLIV